MFNKLDELIEEKEKLQKLMRKNGENAIKETFKEVFKKCPQFQALRWTQYTPYFNDGEACEFRIGDIEAKIEGLKSEYSDSDDDFISTWDLSNKDESYKTLKLLNQKLSKLEEILEMTFGDHAQVTITPKSIEVEEYEHD